MSLMIHDLARCATGAAELSLSGHARRMGSLALGSPLILACAHVLSLIPPRALLQPSPRLAPPPVRDAGTPYLLHRASHGPATVWAAFRTLAKRSLMRTPRAQLQRPHSLQLLAVADASPLRALAPLSRSRVYSMLPPHTRVLGRSAPHESLVAAQLPLLTQRGTGTRSLPPFLVGFGGGGRGPIGSSPKQCFSFRFGGLFRVFFLSIYTLGSWSKALLSPCSFPSLGTLDGEG